LGAATAHANAPAVNRNATTSRPANATVNHSQTQVHTTQVHAQARTQVSHPAPHAAPRAAPREGGGGGGEHHPR